MLEDLDKDQIDLLIERIHASGALGHGQRPHALLKYICDKESAGEGDRLKAYSIGIDVFGKTANFDPSNDSIVRVEMGRLRSALELYFERSGDKEPYVLTVPKGRYVPELVRRQLDPGSEKASRFRLTRTKAVIGASLLGLASVGLLVGVPLLEKLSSAPACASLRPRLILPQTIEGAPSAEQAKDLLRRFQQFIGYYALTDSTDRYARCTGAPVYALQLQQSGNPLELRANLTNIKTKIPVWSALVSANEVAGADHRDILMARLAYLLGPGDGVIPNTALGEKWGDKASFEEYNCAMKSFAFLSTQETNDLNGIKICLRHYFKKSRHADISGYLADMENYKMFNPEHMAAHKSTVFDEATDMGESLNQNDSQLLMAQLRFERTYSSTDFGPSLVLINRMQQLYPFEPNVQNQISQTNSKLICAYDKVNARYNLSYAISGDDTMWNWPIFYQAVYKDDFSKLSSNYTNYMHYGGFLNGIGMMYIGDRKHEPNTFQVGKDLLAHSDCPTKSCIRKAIPRIGMCRALAAKILDFVEKHDIPEFSVQKK